MESRKLLPILTLAIVLLSAALIWFYPPTGDFRAGNPFWNGLATFTTKFKASLMESFDTLPSSPKGTALIIVPYGQFAETELKELRNYVSLGGTLIILDDYGYGNQILHHLELDMSFTGKPLLDPLFNYKNKWLPRITDFTPTPIASGVGSIVLNHASSLSNTSDAMVIAWSSRFSFLDLDDDSMWDPGELTGPLPVAAYVKVDEGYVVAIADPSILINSIISMDDNINFIRNVTELKDPNPKILIDQFHLPKTHLDEAKEMIATTYTLASSPLGTLGLITVILALTLTPIWRKGEKH